MWWRAGYRPVYFLAVKNQTFSHFMRIWMRKEISPQTSGIGKPHGLDLCGLPGWTRCWQAAMGLLRVLGLEPLGLYLKKCFCWGFRWCWNQYVWKFQKNQSSGIFRVRISFLHTCENVTHTEVTTVYINNIDIHFYTNRKNVVYIIYIYLNPHIIYIYTYLHTIHYVYIYMYICFWGVYMRTTLLMYAFPWPPLMS